MYSRHESSKQRRNNVVETSLSCINVDTTLHRRVRGVYIIDLHQDLPISTNAYVEVNFCPLIQKQLVENFRQRNKKNIFFSCDIAVPNVTTIAAKLWCVVAERAYPAPGVVVRAPGMK